MSIGVAVTTYPPPRGSPEDGPSPADILTDPLLGEPLHDGQDPGRPSPSPEPTQRGPGSPVVTQTGGLGRLLPHPSSPFRGRPLRCPKVCARRATTGVPLQLLNGGQPITHLQRPLRLRQEGGHHPLRPPPGAKSFRPSIFPGLMPPPPGPAAGSGPSAGRPHRGVPPGS